MKLSMSYRLAAIAIGLTTATGFVAGCSGDDNSTTPIIPVDAGPQPDSTVPTTDSSTPGQDSSTPPSDDWDPPRHQPSGRRQLHVRRCELQLLLHDHAGSPECLFAVLGELHSLRQHARPLRRALTHVRTT